MTTKASNIKTNDLMSITYYFKVTGVKNNGSSVSCRDVTNDKMTFDINGTDLLESCASADQVTTEERVTMTKAAELLVNAHGVPFTVCFTKQDGKDRVLRGRLLTPEPLLGRSKVEDLDLPGNNPTARMRQVDHRTIKYIVLNGVKHVVR